MDAVPAPAHKLVRIIALLCTTLLAVLLVQWVAADPIERLNTDWTAFDNAGDRFRAQDTIYRLPDVETEPFPYLYPPFALWLAVPLSWLGFWGSYAVSALVPLVAYVLGLGLFGRLGDGRQDRTTGFVLALASGVAFGATLIGQYSGLYALFLGAGAYLFTRDRRMLAGVVLALLWIKPNVAIAVPVVLVWSRSWKTLRGFGLGTVGLLLASLPFGVGQWSAFAESARRMAELQEEGLVPIDKMVTVLSSIQTNLGLEAEPTISIAIWLVVAGVLGVSVLVPWTRGRLADDPLRAFGALGLFVVAANPRLYFYDGALAAIGMYGVWLSAQRSGSAVEKRWLTIAGLMLWVGLWGAVWSGLNVFVGPVAGAALVLVAVERVRSERVFDTDDNTDSRTKRVISEFPHENTPEVEAA